MVQILWTFLDLATARRQNDVEDELLLVALQSVPPMYGEVIRYHFLGGLSHQKIADFLEIPVSTVKWRTFRGKQLLRCTLSPESRCLPACRMGCARLPTAPVPRLAA